MSTLRNAWIRPNAEQAGGRNPCGLNFSMLCLISVIASAITVFSGSAFSDAGEVRIGVQFGLIYLPVTVADAQELSLSDRLKSASPGMFSIRFAQNAMKVWPIANPSRFPS